MDALVIQLTDTVIVSQSLYVLSCTVSVHSFITTTRIIKLLGLVYQPT
jgi:hypothetical protein